MEIKVYETKKYEIFKKLEGNRDVYSVKKIKDSIEEVGYIPSPICVNENMEIIDGQNRLEALKSLNMPVHYYIVKGIGIKEARQMNIGRKNWTFLDYIKSYAETGDKNYSYYVDMLSKHKEYTYRELWAIYYGTLEGRHISSEVIKYGKLGFDIQTMKSKEPLFETLNEIHESLSKVTGYTAVVVPTFAWIIQHPKVDISRVISIVNNKYPLFMPAVTPEVVLKDFSKYYNQHLSPAKRISFDIDYRLSKEKGEVK